MEYYNSLYKNFPNLYPYRINFECGPGWYEIIKELSSRLDEIIEKEFWDDEPPYAIQVKEKFGTLRFYLSSFTDEMDHLINIVEGLSAYCCEVCGKSGFWFKDDDGWYYTRCEKCWGEPILLQNT